MSTNRYTIKQLSDELGVTKPGIRKLMNSSFRKRYTTITGNRNHFGNHKTETDRKQETETTENSLNASNSNDSKSWWKRIF